MAKVEILCFLRFWTNFGFLGFQKPWNHLNDVVLHFGCKFFGCKQPKRQTEKIW